MCRISYFKGSRHQHQRQGMHFANDIVYFSSAVVVPYVVIIYVSTFVQGFTPVNNGYVGNSHSCGVDCQTLDFDLIIMMLCSLFVRTEKTVYI